MNPFADSRLPQQTPPETPVCDELFAYFPPPGSTIVIGVGNIILSDDGVGVHAAKAIEKDSRAPKNISILDGGTLGLELIPYALGASRILFLDAVNSGQMPGTLTRWTGKELLGESAQRSVHQVGVADLIAALALLRDDQEILVLGIQPATTDWGTSLSPRLEAALVSLVEAALDQLQRWDASRNVSLRADCLRSERLASGPDQDAA